MTVDDRLAAAQRWAVIVAMAGGALVYRRSAGDIFALPKATLIELCAVLVVAIGSSRAVLVGRATLPRGPAAWAAGAFAAALVVCTVTSTQPAQSFVGQYAQLEGLVQYGSYVLLALAVLQAFRTTGSVLTMVRALVAVGLVVAGYALLQWTGHDPVEWSQRGSVFSFLGNPDYLGGWCGIVAPLGLLLVVRPEEPFAWRLAGGVFVVVDSVAAYASRSFQGPVAAAVGLVLLVLVVGLPHVRRDRISRRALLVGGLLLVVVAAGAGPRLYRATDGGIENGLLERRHFWRAAVEIGLDHPIVGTGLDTFHNQYLRHRSAAHAALPGGQNAGAAHDVLLDDFANGGVLLLGTYLAFVGLTAWRLLVGLRRAAGDRRLVLAGVGAAWAAYHVQSLVSIDRPPNAALQFVLAALIHVLVAGEPPIVRSPGRRVTRRQHEVEGRAVAVTALVGVLAVVAGWFVTQPLRADFAYARGAEEVESDPDRAVRDITRALRLLPSEARYTFELSQAHLQLDEVQEAVQAAARGLRLEPGDSSYALYAASLAQQADDVAAARAFYRRAVEVDPYGLEGLLGWAQLEATQGHPARARGLVDRALAVTRTRTDVWARAAEVYAALHDSPAEAEARTRAQGG